MQDEGPHRPRRRGPGGPRPRATGIDRDVTCSPVHLFVSPLLTYSPLLTEQPARRWPQGQPPPPRQPGQARARARVGKFACWNCSYGRPTLQGWPRRGGLARFARSRSVPETRLRPGGLRRYPRERSPPEGELTPWRGCERPRSRTQPPRLRPRWRANPPKAGERFRRRRRRRGWTAARCRRTARENRGRMPPAGAVGRPETSSADILYQFTEL